MRNHEVAFVLCPSTLNCSINGPFAVLTSYISEFHSAKYRAKVQLAMGLVFSGASLFIPLGAWAIFQTSINIKLFEFLSK